MPNDAVIHSFDLINALVKAGVQLPENTRSATLRFNSDELVVLTIEVLVSASLLHKIAATTCAHLVSERLVDS